MAQDLHHEYQADSSVSRQEVRAALSALTEDDITETSPITAGVPEAGIEVDGDTVHVRVEGHEGDWSKTSEEAVRKAVKSVEGVSELAGSEGGYDG